MVEKVGYTRPAISARSVKRTGSADGAAFADALSKAEGTSEASANEATSSIAAMHGIGVLLGAQEVDEREAQRRKAVKQGRLTLDALAQLRDALLMGELPIGTIRQLERLVAEERLTADPALRGILDEIELRAAVELAKLEMAGYL